MTNKISVTIGGRRQAASITFSVNVCICYVYMILYMIFFMIDGKDFIMYARDDDDASVVTPSLRLFSCYRAAIIIIL